MGAAIMTARHSEKDQERLIIGHSSRIQALLGKSRQSLKTGRGLPRAAFWSAVKQRHKKAK
jgi:hypothetical protein